MDIKKARNYKKGINPRTDAKLGRHNEALKTFKNEFETARKLLGLGVRMKLRENLKDDGYIENLDGKGFITFDWELPQDYTGYYERGLILIKSRKLRKFHDVDMFIHGSQDGKAFTAGWIKDINKDKPVIRQMWEPSSQSMQNVTCYQIEYCKEWKITEMNLFVEYIKGKVEK